VRTDKEIHIVCLSQISRFKSLISSAISETLSVHGKPSPCGKNLLEPNVSRWILRNFVVHTLKCSRLLLLVTVQYNLQCVLCQLAAPTDITRTQYTKCRLCGGWESNARNIQKLLIPNKLNKKCITLVSLYWYTMMSGQQNIRFSAFCSNKMPLSSRCKILSL
jgi:hypothetical protein